MKLKLARTGTTTNTKLDDAPTEAAAKPTNQVPSPSIESFIEGVRQPWNRDDIVRQDIALSDRPAPTTPKPTMPAPADQVAAITDHRKRF